MNPLLRSYFFIPLLSVVVASQVNAAEKVARTVGDAPERVIYGPDDRLDYYQVDDPILRARADASAGVLDDSGVSDNGNGTFAIATSLYSVCPEEPFAGQPDAMFCSAWWVGDNIIITAGHCIDSSTVTNTTFVFGFHMENASTPVLDVPANHIYRATSLVSQVFDGVGTLDYAVVQIDRPVDIPGVEPIRIRRTGSPAVGDQVGVIGHPSGIPQKIAFGATTAVNDISATDFFQANLDTYGGNSGSPVFNQVTGFAEGILVRGQNDFVQQGGCLVSNRLPDDSSNTEDATRSTRFQQFVPEPDGIFYDRVIYGGTDILTIFVQDAGATAPISATITADSGDSESPSFTFLGGGLYSATLSLGSVTPNRGPGSQNNGVLEGIDGDIATATYTAASTATHRALARLELGPPQLISQEMISATDTTITLRLELSEPATVDSSVFGGSCMETLVATDETGFNQTHTITYTGLSSCTDYFFEFEMTDMAGNTGFANQTGGCFVHSTVDLAPGSISESFEAGAPAGWATSSTNPSNTWSFGASANAQDGTAAARLIPASDTTTDAFLSGPTFTAPTFVTFYHTYAFESTYDGGVIEYSLNGGGFQDAGNLIVSGGYTGTIDTGFSSPIGGQQAWTGGSLGEMTPVTVDLTGVTGDVQFRFRWASDSSVISGGWEIDSFSVKSFQSCEAGPQNAAYAKTY